MRAETRYYIYEALALVGIGTTVVVYVPFLLSIGLSLSEVALVNVVFWVVTILSEVPTGAMADGKGRAYSLKWGSVFWVIGALAYMSASGFWTAALAEALIGVGRAFFSGAEQAWLKDTLDREGRSRELMRVNANASIIRGASMLLGGLFGALISLVAIRLIWLPLAILSLLNLVFIVRYMNGRGETLDPITEREAFRESVQLLRRRGDLRWIVLAMIVFGGVVSLNHFWSPFFDAQVERVTLAGVWAVMYLAVVLASAMISRYESRIRPGTEPGLIVLGTFLAGAGLLLAGLATGWVLPLSAIVIHEFGRGIFTPVKNTFVQHRVPNRFLATFTSLQELIGNIGFVITPIVVAVAIVGKPDTPETIATVWIWTGSLLVLGSIVLWVLRPVNQKTR